MNSETKAFDAKLKRILNKLQEFGGSFDSLDDIGSTVEYHKNSLNNFLNDFLDEVNGFVDVKKEIEARDKAIREQEIKIRELERFKTYHLGLWATDRPDLIPDRLKDIFFEIEGKTK